MSVVSLDEYRNRTEPVIEVEALSDADYASEGEADMALQLADAQARIAELELVLVETLKRNAMNWARAQEAETKLSVFQGEG